MDLYILLDLDALFVTNSIRLPSYEYRPHHPSDSRREERLTLCTQVFENFFHTGHNDRSVVYHSIAIEEKYFDGIDKLLILLWG